MGHTSAVREAKLTVRPETASERIARKARVAGADGGMIDHLAASVSAACAGAGVDALLVDAGAVERTLRADHTLGPARGGHADVAGLTLAYGYAVGSSTHAQRPTGAGEAGVGGPLGPERSCER